MKSLIQLWHGHVFPSRAYEDGGIHEAIADYEDAVFFDILAEELARRDLGEDCDDYNALAARIDEYMDEFEANGVENLTLREVRAARSSQSSPRSRRASSSARIS